ncbi:MAG: hypothetical protein Q4G49_18165 [Paracoccus sp. (in: a-proteobacteria)]|nr:hypothetical protein [Paracoccus sp. (in: a-proteobacteria)]
MTKTTRPALIALARDLLTGIATHLTTGRRCIGLHLLYGAVRSPVADAKHRFFQVLSGIDSRDIRHFCKGKWPLAEAAVCGLRSDRPL